MIADSDDAYGTKLAVDDGGGSENQEFPHGNKAESEKFPPPPTSLTMNSGEQRQGAGKLTWVAAGADTVEHILHHITECTKYERLHRRGCEWFWCLCRGHQTDWENREHSNVPCTLPAIFPPPGGNTN